MTKLSNARVSWAVWNVVFGRVSPGKAAVVLGVSERRVQQLAAGTSGIILEAWCTLTGITTLTR